MNWFALTVKHRHEKAVEGRLLDKQIEAYAPLQRVSRRWCDRTRILETPLFPGYVFGRFSAGARSRVLSTAGVRSIVSFCGHAAPVDERDLNAIKAVVSSGLPVTPWPAVRAGQRVRLCAGPLNGVEGIVDREKDSWRIIVNLELLNRAISAQIPRCDIEPVAAPGRRAGRNQ